MIQVYHGDGKGKTTAAIGLAVRFSGAGKKVLFCQFMKGNISSEIGVLQKLENLEVTKDHGVKDKIQAMTGATISSRAFTLGVKQAVEKAAQLGGK